jgi:hypothetical protein
LSISKNEKSLGGIVLNDLPLAFTNLVSGMAGSRASLTLPSSAAAMLVPVPPGV